MSHGMLAKLVWDGGPVHVPVEMGTPAPDQLQGTDGEQLSELAGRICYDSLGAAGARPSFSTADKQGYHEHIRAVGHGSVYEHYHFTVELHFERGPLGQALQALLTLLCANRPGVFLRSSPSQGYLRLTLNPRVLLDWQHWGSTRTIDLPDRRYLAAERDLLGCLKLAANHHLPHVFPRDSDQHTTLDDLGLLSWRRAKPVTDDERWVALYIAGSRGMSHELVRHGDFTAISQRSTRFVDECDSPWVEHPLVTRYCRSLAAQLRPEDLDRVRRRIQVTMEASQGLYRELVPLLQAWLKERGTDALGARKQARGAARGYLGNALSTELIFSASVAQWRWMLQQRGSVFADAEIREVFASKQDCVLGALQASRYAASFQNFTLQPSPDGLGQVAQETHGT
jgi:thymidylate synthase ThyX